MALIKAQASMVERADINRRKSGQGQDSEVATGC